MLRANALSVTSTFCIVNFAPGKTEKSVIVRSWFSAVLSVRQRWWHNPNTTLSVYLWEDAFGRAKQNLHNSRTWLKTEVEFSLFIIPHLVYLVLFVCFVFISTLLDLEWYSVVYSPVVKEVLYLPQNKNTVIKMWKQLLLYKLLEWSYFLTSPKDFPQCNETEISVYITWL